MHRTINYSTVSLDASKTSFSPDYPNCAAASTYRELVALQPIAASKSVTQLKRTPLRTIIAGAKQLRYTVDHSMHGSAMQCYAFRFPIGTCDFWTPPHRNPLADRYEILHNRLGRRDYVMCKK
jgi:hypothetical protein